MILLQNTTPGAWDGTFAVLIRELARDLLLDGDTEIAVNNEARLRTLTGYRSAGDRLVFTGGETIAVEEITEIQVPS